MISLILSSLASLRHAAYPCCPYHEDCVSAVNSYEAMEKVKAQPDNLEFAILKIEGLLPQATLEELHQWLLNRIGVHSTTVKISASQKSAGFVFEKRCSKDSLTKDLERDFPELDFKMLQYN